MLLSVATGYNKSQINDCLEFLEPYNSVNNEMIMEILDSETMVELFQRLAANDQVFKLEEHQIPGIQTSADFDIILWERAKKLGKPHVLSHGLE